MALLPYEHLEREVLEMALRSDNPEEGNPTSMWLLQEKLQLWLEASDGREITACLRRLHESKQIEVWKLENNTWIKFLPGFKDDDFFYTLLFYIRPTKFTSPHLQKLNAKNDKNEVMTDQLKAQSTVKPVNSPVRKVFVVHGHDDGARESVARFLERANFEAIILHEQANSGRTIIEKIEDHGDVGFAVVLLAPDDEGCKRGESLKPRARQNVVLELGYFLGRLGRSRVCALKVGENLEIPSDFGGVVYVPFDSGGGWKQALGKELEQTGFPIDWKKLMGSRS